MGQSEFCVAGATGNSNASVTVKSAVRFFPAPPSLLSFISPRSSLAALCVFGSRALSTIQKGTASSLDVAGMFALWACSKICVRKTCHLSQASSQSEHTTLRDNNLTTKLNALVALTISHKLHIYIDLM